jgi:hypothetical protein
LVVLKKGLAFLMLWLEAAERFVLGYGRHLASNRRTPYDSSASSFLRRSLEHGDDNG